MAMSFDEWYEKKKKNKDNEKTAQATRASQRTFDEWYAEKYGGGSNAISEAEKNSALAWRSDEIAPVGGGNKNTWVKSGGFSDGVDGVGDFFGDLGQTILGTVGDLGLNIVKGAGRTVEGVTDLVAYGVSGVADLFGADDFAEHTKKQAQRSIVDEATQGAEDWLDQYSVLGDKADMIGEGLGQVASIILTGGVAAGAGLGTAGVTAVTTGLTGLSGMGGGMGEAYQAGASDGDAFKYGLTKGSIEAGTELLFGGLGKASKAIGLGKSAIPLDDFLAKSVTKKITNQTAKNLVQYGIKASAEGVEEVIAGYLTAHAKKGTYMPEEDFDKILEDENLLESFVVGTLTSAIAQSGYIPATQSGSVRESIKTGRDFITGYTQNEQSVIDKEVKNRIAEKEKSGKKLTKREIAQIEELVQNDLDKGYISTDTIEEILGGDDYKAYKKTVDTEESLKSELAELQKMEYGKMNDIQHTRLNELKGMNLEDTTKRNDLRAKLDSKIKPLLKDSKLAESYNEIARRGQAFEADLSQYDERQIETYKRAINSGVLNNTNRSHELVSVLAKIEADKGIVFDFTNNEKLKESGFAIEGKTVNGFANKTAGAVTLNVQSAKAWQSTVGHEITHILEGTESYGALQEALYAYAESKGELESRRASLTELYKDMDADIEAELTADLVGDYLFTDKDFINKLTGNVSLFKKVWNEVKYLCKVATGKELTEIEMVEREFASAWKQMRVKTAEGDGKIDYSISQVDGIDYVQAEKNIFTKEDGTLASEKEVFDSLVGKAINLSDGKVTIVKNLPEKDMYNELYRRYPSKFGGVEDIKQLNSDVNYNMKELLSTSELKKANVPDKNNRHAKQGITSFDTRTVKFYDGQRAYTIDFSIGNLQNGEKIAYAKRFYGYDAELTKKIQTAESRRSENTPFNQQSVSEDIIPQNSEKSSGNTSFSLSKTVEETKNLIALHNLTESKLNKVMDLGGFPMPSIAVTRTDIPHTNFGDITLVMNKSTIDPKANRKNTVYSADAWTPTVPRTEYKPNDSRLREISNKIYDLIGNRKVVNALDYVAFDTDNVSRDLDNTDGNITDKYLNNNTMKYAFLKDVGAEIELPTKEAALSRGISNDAVRYFSGKLVNGLQTVEHYQNMSATEMMNDAELTSAVAEALNQDILRQFEEGTENYEQLKSNPVYKADELSFSQIDSLLSGVRKYLNYGIEQTVDGREAKNTISNYFNENNLQEQYENWLNQMFEGVVEKTGIYNNKDIFTPSGNRRTFEQLHLPVTLENIVKAMASQNDGNTKNVAGFNGVKTLRAGMAERFKSIDDMHKLEGRLQHLTEEEFEAIHDQLSERMNGVINSILETAPEMSGNIYMRMDSVGETLMEIAESGKYSTDAIIKTVNQYIYNIDENIADEIRTLLYDVSQMPTNMFEAKPERAVGFDEVNAAILPDNADNALRERLESMGVQVLTYEKGNDTDRLNKLNSLLEEQPDWKFSLSKQGEEIAPIGNYSTPLNETALAPMREDVPKTENTPKVGTVAENTVVEDAPFFTDEDAPPEMDAPYYEDTDTTALDNKALKNIGKSLRETLSLTAEETRAIQEIVQEYSTSETPNADNLFDTIKEKFGEKLWKIKNEDIAEVKRFLRNSKVNVTPNIKSNIADYSAFRKSIGGKLGISKDGLPVDIAYQQLVEMYPAFFSEDILTETDQFLRMVEVASADLYQHESYQLDDATIQEAVNIITNEVGAYKQNLTRIAAEETAREALDSVAPPKAEQIANGSRSEALLLDSLDNFPIKTVEDKVAEKLRAVEAELTDNKHLRREAEANYNKQIANLSDEYAALKDKSTKKANNIVQRVIRLERLKASADADFAKRISDLEARVEKMSDPKYSRAMFKQEKMQEHAKFAEDLLGDTSTWVDKKLGLQYSTNTERRNLRDIVRDAEGNKDIAKADAIDDALNGQYNREEAAKKREQAEISEKYADFEITKAESEYIQMLGELRHNPETTLTEEVVNEYYEKHKNKIDADKVDAVIDLARQDFDSLLERLNAALRAQGMKEIPYRKGYFPHFTDPKQNFIQKLLNWKTQDNEIPTSIAGLTETFKPVKSWQSFDKTRYSDETDYNFLKGFDTYLNGALDWIYHIDTLQKRRAVENHIRFTHSDEGIKARIKEVYANEELDANEAQAQIEHILSEAKNPLNNFVQDFMTHTNILAGKKNSLDRTVEQSTNRSIYSVMTNVQNRMSANMVLANVRSALTNFIPITQSWAQVSPLRSLQATKDTIANAIKDDGVIEKSTFLTNRLREPDKLFNTTWDKVLDKAGIMFEIVDSFSSQVIWRSKYNQNLANGMSEIEAVKNADQFAENVMAGRSKGNEPTLFNAKNPLVKAFTMFQLEVNNQYGYLFKDAPNDLKAETEHWKLNLAKGYTTAFIGAYVYNALLEQVAGSGAALDPISVVKDLLKDLGLFGDDEEKEPDEVIMNLVENVGEELPFVGGTLFGGGRIPISSALPYGENGVVEGIGDFVSDVTEGNWGNIGSEMMNPLLNVGLPVGGGQLKKTVQGLSMFNTDEEHPIAGSYTDSGDLRFPVDDTLGNRIQAGIFGQWANKNAREYIDGGYAPLSPKNTQEFIDVDLPIADYWKYREGLKGLKTLNEKGDYIGDLDLPVSKKNILINNIADRSDPIDYTGYENYGDFQEFDFAQKYPEKYAVLKENGISVSDYKNNIEETAFLYTDDYSWAADNPIKYAVSKAVTNDVTAYKQYTSELYNIKADKDRNGKSVSGSRKTKVVEYVNNLDLDYGAKLILFKSEYPSDDTYNADIINYINSRNDLTYEERVMIYEELGFTVKNGRVYWD